LGVVGGSHAMQQEKPEILADDEFELLAAFLQNVFDCSEIWSELEPAARMRAERETTKELEECSVPASSSMPAYGNRSSKAALQRRASGTLPSSRSCAWRMRPRRRRTEPGATLKRALLGQLIEDRLAARLDDRRHVLAELFKVAAEFSRESACFFWINGDRLPRPLAYDLAARSKPKMETAMKIDDAFAGTLNVLYQEPEECL
jgi:hypothetical protein